MHNPEMLAAVTEVTRKLVDEGKLIEAGWTAFRMLTIPKDAPPAQLDEMRCAFFAGAQHLFGSINSIMSSDDEPTDQDVAGLEQINNELTRFIGEMKLRISRAKGRA